MTKTLEAAQLASQVKLLTIKETAELLGVSDRTVWTLTDRGELPCVRIGRSVRYSIESLREWIQKQESKN